MKYTPFLLILSLSLAHTARGQKKAPRAKALLKAVYQKYQNQKDADIRFDWDLYDERTGVHRKSKGMILIKGNRYLLRFMGVEQLFDGTRLYTINPDDREINISKGDGGNIFVPDRILSAYQKDYRLSWDIAQRVSGRDIQFVRLKPKHQSDTRYILIGVDAKAKRLYRVIDVDKKGVTTELTLIAYKADQGIPEARFTFDKDEYPGYLRNYLE
ncbi:MAG: outer membrane lipoprotein carrier protein LolA [Flavobacteriales bacterium]